jgi:hypothetical protein
MMPELATEWTDGIDEPDTASPASNGTNELPAIEDAADFIDRDIATPPDVIVDLLHQGSKMVLGGSSKSNKTWLQADLAVSVAAGAMWLGKQTRKGRVLYINLELGTAFFQKRIQVVSRAKEVRIEPGQLMVWNLRGYAADLSTLLGKILEAAGSDKFDLIVIDPIYKVLGNRDENRAGDIASLLNQIERLAVQSGAAVVFGAHFSKGNQAAKESIDRIGGSGVFARDPDSILIFTKHEEDDAFTVDATLRNHPPLKPFVVRWKFPLMVVDDLLDPSKLKQIGGRTKQHHKADLLALLGTDSLRPTKWKKLAAGDCGMSERTFYRLLRELREAKLVVKNAAGKWSKT